MSQQDIQSHGMTPMPQNPKRRYQGEYIGIVESIDDPDKLMRVRVRVKGVFTDDVPVDDLPWATYRLPIGFRPNDGLFTPVDVGDYVWVDFPFGGDTRRPRITGSVHYCPESTPNFPDDAWEGPDGPQAKRSGDEPEASEKPQYSKDCIYKQHGVQAEIREDGTFRITQAQTGTNVEITKDGAVILHGVSDLFITTETNRFDQVAGDEKRDITGNDDVTIGADASLTVMGDMTEHVTGSIMSEATGDYQASAQRVLKLTSAEKIVIQAPSVEIN
ncbi:phage baseplate assembly protein V [Desulfatirhabdium butyrativorans]|uniref:phage baseplate assembly protein V n=1 Tax=Desulfatirhabdium butyrativorans TaxID=340467 RepID=UPI0004199A25|nr:phage baseplate assembly protein V [Desulfatirhabdium butyrativorans]